MKDKIDYECIKEISRALKKRFKGIEAFTYGFCCNTDYYAGKKTRNENDFVNAKIFKGGLNNCYRRKKDWWSGNYKGYFELGESVFFNWNLTNFKLDDIVDYMSIIVIKYGYKVITPVNDAQCIELTISK